MRHTALTALPLLLPAGFFLSFAAAADPITDQIDAARKAYERGEPKVAIQALQFAVAQIEEQLSSARLALLPAPLDGWSAEEASGSSGGLVGLVTGTTISRTYREKASGAQVSIRVSADSPLLAMMNMMMSSPMFFQVEPGTKPYTHDGHRGVLQLGDTGSHQGSIELSLMIGTRLLLQLEGTKGATQDMLESYLERIDLKALEKALIG